MPFRSYGWNLNFCSVFLSSFHFSWWKRLRLHNNPASSTSQDLEGLVQPYLSIRVELWREYLTRSLETEDIGLDFWLEATTKTFPLTSTTILRCHLLFQSYFFSSLPTTLSNTGNMKWKELLKREKITSWIRTRDVRVGIQLCANPFHSSLVSSLLLFIL